MSVDKGLVEFMYVYVHNCLLNSGYIYPSQEKELCYVLSNFEVRCGACLALLYCILIRYAQFSIVPSPKCTRKVRRATSRYSFQ